MKGRRAARRMALDAIYQGEIRDRLPIETFEEQLVGGRVVPGTEDGPALEDEGSDDSEIVAYARELVTGVQEHHAAIDELLARYADRWAIDRMPVVDRTLLRIAVFEILWREDVPIAVAINEAVEIAKTMSTDDSGRFINGLLGRIAEESSLPGN